MSSLVHYPRIKIGIDSAQINLMQLTLTENLPMWPSGHSTRPPYAVECDALSGRGSRLRREVNMELIPGSKRV